MSLNVDRASTAFTFKGGMLPMTVMELISADPERIREQLAGKLSQSPAFFQHTPVVLSVEKLDEPHLALERICAVCRAHKPAAGGSARWRRPDQAVGLGTGARLVFRPRRSSRVTWKASPYPPETPAESVPQVAGGGRIPPRHGTFGAAAYRPRWRSGGHRLGQCRCRSAGSG